MIKSLWFLVIFIALGVSWLLCTLLILNVPTRFIFTKEEMWLLALLLPAIISALACHLLWMLDNDWLRS
jgi:hypothetical protein